MELYHNQVIRAQGAFSLRMFHRSWGIMMIQANISAPCTVLDFPTREAFARKITSQHYNIVGISSIITNVGKTREMCRMVRQLSPQSAIILGGHVTAIPAIESLVDADHYVRGEGISWMRRHLGEDETAPIKHPEIVSGLQTGAMGVRLPERRGATAATIIPSVGCPMGCNFCTTSSFFGGKGKFHNFYETGDQLFDIMEGFENSMKVQIFFVMDENFLLHRQRAMQLLERMKAAGKSWGLAVFVELGLDLDGPEVGELQVRQAGRQRHSRFDARIAPAWHPRAGFFTIIGLEHHTPGNIAQEIEHAVSHETDFHQFMLYTPVSGNSSLCRNETGAHARVDRSRRYPRPVQI
jgi:hypothetical protein